MSNYLSSDFYKNTCVCVYVMLNFTLSEILTKVSYFKCNVRI